MWATVKLGELLDVQNGYAFNSKQFSSEGEMPLIRIRDLKAGLDTKTRYTGEYDDKYIVKKGDLFFTTYDQDHMAYFLKTTHFLSYSSRKRSKIDYENDLVRLNMNEEPEIKRIISKYK